jgi:hypothetical protein
MNYSGADPQDKDHLACCFVVVTGRNSYTDLQSGMSKMHKTYIDE